MAVTLLRGTLFFVMAWAIRRNYQATIVRQKSIAFKPDLWHCDFDKFRGDWRMVRTTPGGEPATETDDQRGRLYFGFYVSPEDAAVIDAFAEGFGENKSAIGRRALRDFMAQNKYPQVKALLLIFEELLRSAAANSPDGRFLDSPPGFVAAMGEIIRLCETFPRPTGMPEGRIPTPRKRAEQFLSAVADTESMEFSGTWAERIRAALGPETMARLAKKHAADLARLEAMENREPPPPVPAAQAGWADAVMLAKDAGIEAEIATARAQISRIDRLPKTERAAAIKEKRRQVSTWRGLDDVTREELLAALAAISDNAD
jgi:hypothetical protein